LRVFLSILDGSGGGVAEIPVQSIRKPSFANSLIVRGALLMLLALVVFAAGSYYFIVRPTVNGLADAQMRLVSQQLEARVSQLLQSVETTLRSSRGWGLDGSLDHSELLRFNEYFFPIIANHPEISSVNFAHESGREILLLKNEDGTWVNRLSNPDRWGQRTYWLHWSSTHRLERVEMRMLDYDTRKRLWHKGAMALPNDEAIYWTEPYIFFTTKDPGITAAMRWTGSDGSHYVIGHDVRLLELSAFTTGLTIGDSGRAALLQADGKLLAPPHDARFSNTDAIRAAVLKTPTELGLTDIDQGISAWRKSASPANVIGNFEFSGNNWFSLFHPIAAGNQNLWLGVFAPEQEFLPTNRENLLVLGAIAVLAILAGVFASFRIASQFGRPLVKLAKESARIGRLELEAPVVIDAPWWEVQRLADAQESMRVRLKDANDVLEREVAERTRELRESQAALQERETIFRAIFENAAIGISSLTPELKRQRVNRAFCEFTGYTEAELLSGSGLDLIAPADRARVRTGYQDLASGRLQNFRTETGMVHRDGSLHWADVQLTAIRDANDNGKVVSLLATILDITDRRAMEDELERQFALMQALLNTIPNPIFYKGADTRFLGCNKAYEEAFGISLHQFVGKRVGDLSYLPEGDRAIFQTEDEAVIARTGRVAREVPMKFADGEMHDTLYSVTGFSNRDGLPGGLVGLIVDITPLKKAEREAQQARAAAEAAASAKADFLANMSHEIRTPMNAIIGLTHIALQTELTDRQRGYLEKVDTASKSLLGIINDILDFSKIEAGMLAIEAVEFSLEQVLRHVADLSIHKAEDKSLALTFDTAPDVPDSLIGDPLRLQQVLINLVGNALKFTERGEVAVAVKCVGNDGAHIRLRIEVRDTGIGMTREQRTRLFSPFTQADTSTTRRYGGTGLGLSICKRLVELMGGKIDVASSPGQGSCFFFEVPLDRGTRPASTQQSSRRPRDLMPVVLHGRRVLLVEDNDINREMAEEILAAAGMVVDGAADGAEAVALAARVKYDAILMDCHMPVMDGFEATRRIRAGSPNAAVPILAMTASVLLGDREMCLEAGMNDHVAKPVDVAELYAKLASWIAGVKAEGATNGSVEAPVPQAGGASADAPVLDKATALARLAGNEDMYRRLLQKFCAGQADAVVLVRAELAAGDRDGARRRVHTLKGLAGNIGATALWNEAAEAERCIAANELVSLCEASISRLDSELARVIAMIDEALRSDGQSPAPGDAPSNLADDLLASQLAELRALLASDDADAVRVLDKVRSTLTARLPGDGVERLMRAVGHYEFENAVQILQQIAANLGFALD
jgi:PAS domain S-box-containing protein